MKSILRNGFRVRAWLTAMYWMVPALLVPYGAAMPGAAQAQAVVQVPTATRVAGNITSGYNGDSGHAIATDLSNPSYSTFDTLGNQYISDTGNNCVRKVDTAGNMTVLVGYEATPASTDTCAAAGLPVTSTQGLLAPTGIAVDAAGNVFIADNGHNCIRKVAGGLTGAKNLVAVVDTCKNTALNSISPNPTAILLDPIDDVIASIVDNVNTPTINQVIFHGVHDPATLVCDIVGQTSTRSKNTCPFFDGHTYDVNTPQGLALDQAGNYYLADMGNACIRELSAQEVFSTVLGQCISDGSGPASGAIANFSPSGIAIGDDGYLYIANAAQDTVLKFRVGDTYPSTGPPVIAGIPGQATPYTGAEEGKAAVAVSLNNPTGLSLDPSGNLYVADTGNGIIRQLAFNNQFPTTPIFASSASQTLQFEINTAVNLTETPGADFQIASGSNTCTGSLAPSTTAVPTTCSVPLAFTPIYAGLLRSPLTLTDSIAATPYAFGLSGTGLGANALFIPGTITTPYPALAAPTATVVDSAGDIFYAEAGTGPGTGDIKVVRAGGQATTLVAAGGLIQSPVALALDAAQNLYVADNAANAVFKVSASGAVATFASGLNDPTAVAVDNDGNVYVAEAGTGATEVLKVYAGGQQVIIAGLGAVPGANNVPAAEAKFVQPSGLYLDGSGNLYVSDAGGFYVYKITPGGTIFIFAGNGTQTTTNDKQPTDTGLQGPAGLVGDAGGDIYIADGPANKVYVVFSGSNQNPAIEALVGTGTAGDTGDGFAANLAELSNPISVSLDGAANLYLVDAGNNSIREVDYQDPTLNFGNVKPGVTSAPLGTTLWDAGNASLISLTAFLPVDTKDFAQVSSGCGSSLPIGSTCDLSYDFTPATYGSYLTTASSQSPASDTPEVITLVGNSPQPQFITPAVSAVYGTSYTLQAQITTANAAAPTGTVTFTINGTAICPTAILSAAGTATCTPNPTLENVGGYTVLVSYSGDSNYLAATSNQSLTITPAPVTITAANATRPYNTPNPTFTGTVSPTYPFATGQSITAAYATTAVQSSAPGTYPITPTAVFAAGTLPGNYAVTLVNGTLNITQNSGGVTIVSPAVTTVYGSAYSLSSSITSSQSPQPTGTATFTINGAAICPAATLTASGVATCVPSPTLENVGGYTVVVSYSGDTYYPAAASSIALTVTPAPVTITANSTSRPYDTPNPAFSGTVTGVVTGQSITATYATTAVQTSPPGTYPITPTAVAGSGTTLSNYAITLVNGTLTITQTATTLSLTAPSVTAIYGSAYTLAVSITSSQAPQPTGTVSFTLAGQLLCPPAAVAANGTAACAPSPTLENAGTYTVTVAYSGDTYYLPATATLTLTITPAPVTITANNQTRVVDTANPTLTGTVTGAVAGQSITATFTTPATQASPVGNYPIIPAAVFGAGTVPANYTVSLVNGILSITPAAVTPPTGPTGTFTIAATPPEQEIDHTGTVNFPVTVTSVKGFTDSVTFSCAGLPEGVTCSFAPVNVAPAAGATAATVMTLSGSADSENVPSGSFGDLRNMPPKPGGSPLAPPLFAWTMLPLGFTGSAAGVFANRKRRKGMRRFLWIVPILLLFAGFAAGMVGCASQNNYKIYTVTVTATDTTYATPVAQSTSVTLVLAR